MKRTLMAICAASALGFGFSAVAQNTYAQQQSGDQIKGVQITGCLQKTNSGGYFLTDARASNGAASATREGSAESGSAQRSVRATKTWNLEGHHDQMDSLVGQRVTITGNAENEYSGDKLKGQSSKNTPEMQARDIDVKSVTPAGGSCQQ